MFYQHFQPSDDLPDPSSLWSATLSPAALSPATLNPAAIMRLCGSEQIARNTWQQVHTWAVGSIWQVWLTARQLGGFLPFSDVLVNVPSHHQKSIHEKQGGGAFGRCESLMYAPTKIPTIWYIPSNWDIISMLKPVTQVNRVHQRYLHCAKEWRPWLEWSMILALRILLNKEVHIALVCSV